MPSDFMNTIVVHHFHSPAGELLLGDFDGYVVLCDWTADRQRGRADRRVQGALGATFETGDTPLLRRLREELDEYFAGRRCTFDLPVRYTGTPFEARVISRKKAKSCCFEDGSGLRRHSRILDARPG